MIMMVWGLLFFQSTFSGSFPVVSLKSQMVEYESTICEDWPQEQKNGNKLCWEERKKDGWKERKRSKTSFNGNIGTTRLHFSWAARDSWIYFYHISHHRIEAKKSYFLCITHNNIHVMLDVMCTVKLMLNTMHASYL